MSPRAGLSGLFSLCVMETKIVFITGTDTGVGKTLLTALLLCHLRARGARALALKPFCSGTRADAQLLHDLQDGDLTLEEVNPFYFPEPVAPLVSARKHKKRILLDEVVQYIHSIAVRVGQVPRLPPGSLRINNSKLKTQNYLLIEGSGGLLVPLGSDYTVRDLIIRLNCETIVVSRNKLGTINHTLLTIQALLNPTPHSALRTPHSAIKVVLMDSSLPDVSSASNAHLLAELLVPAPLVVVPFLGPRACRVTTVRRQALRLKAILTRIIG
jgi:dethiobiotin synthetase